MTITDIIRNNIADALGHTPDKNEQEKFIEYIHDEIADKLNANKKVFLVDIEFAIKKCRDEQFKQCEECGDWFLPEEMNEFGYKCINCEPNYDPDFIRELYIGL